MIKRFLLGFFVLAISACSTAIPRLGITPSVADAQTAVFIVVDYNSDVGRLSQIRKVDELEASCWEQGCPPWVRVAPGSHTFQVVYSFSQELIFDVVSPDMKAGHIYVARRNESSGAINITVEELPKGTQYGLGKKADGSYTYPITF